MAISSGLYSVVDILLRSGADISIADQVFISNSELSVAVFPFVIIYLAPLKVQVLVPEDIRNLLDKTKEVRQPVMCIYYLGFLHTHIYTQNSVYYLRGMGSMRRARRRC